VKGSVASRRGYSEFIFEPLEVCGDCRCQHFRRESYFKVSLKAKYVANGYLLLKLFDLTTEIGITVIREVNTNSFLVFVPDVIRKVLMRTFTAVNEVMVIEMKEPSSKVQQFEKSMLRQPLPGR
jgi:hypothetical protein